MQGASKTLLTLAKSKNVFKDQASDLEDDDWAHLQYSHVVCALFGIIVVFAFVLSAEFSTPNFHDMDRPHLDIVCNTTLFVHVLRGDQSCPEQCPFWANDDKTGTLCDFRCVKGKDCGEINSQKTVPDHNGMYCRSCLQQSCYRCEEDGDDRCSECEFGSTLDELTGECRSDFRFIWYTIFGIIGVVAVFIFCWLCHLCCMPVTNHQGLREGFAARSLAKLHKPRMAGLGLPSGKGERVLWPLSTNLLKVPVGGAGLVLHMHLQLALMIWAGTLLVVWIAMAHTNPNNFYQGLRPVATPREFCAVLEWGENSQIETRRTKVHFIIFAYVASSLMHIMHATLQWRRFAESQQVRVDVNEFVACCHGLPKCSGQEPVEEILQSFLQEHTGQEVVGVSVCWDYQGKESEIMQHIEDVMDDLELTSGDQVYDAGQKKANMDFQPSWCARHDPELDNDMDEEIQTSSHCSVFRKIDNVFLGDEKRSRKPVSEQIKDLLNGLESADKAFVVFNTEAARNRAIEAWKSPDLARPRFLGKMLLLEAVDYPPDTILWANVTVPMPKKLVRIVMIVPVLLFVLFMWSVVFWLPFATWQGSFSYGIGQEPDFMMETLFSLVVVMGNLMVLCVCDVISKKVGLFITDTVEQVRMVLYTVAILINTFADCYMVAVISYKNQVSMGATVKGKYLLKDLRNMDDIFTSFAMQKAIGGRFFAMCFPACFLLPFIMEPLFTIVLPRYLSSMVVGRYPHVRGARAESALQSVGAMDMGRYADLILNCTLCAAITLFATGLWLQTFFLFLMSNIYVLAYDHYKVLRVSPGFEYGSNIIDRTANQLLIMPCSLLAATAVFEWFNCDPGWPCLHQGRLVLACGSAFWGHAVIHGILLHYVTPKLGLLGMKENPAKHPYHVVARSAPCTYFSANPVHCLRSAFYYEHKPPCVYFVRGKEHLQRANHKIGTFFEDKAAEIEQFSGTDPNERRGTVAWISDSFMSATTFVKGGPSAKNPQGRLKGRGELELSKLDNTGKVVRNGSGLLQW